MLSACHIFFVMYTYRPDSNRMIISLSGDQYRCCFMDQHVPVFPKQSILESL